MNTRDKLLLWRSYLVYFLTRSKTGKVLVFISLPVIILLVALWKPEYSPPIFDAQVHYNEESWPRVSVNAILNTAEEINVPWMLVASTPNEGTWRLQRNDPQRIIPMFVPYNTREERDTWFENEATTLYIENAFNQGDYRGIGEFFLFDGQVNTPIVKRMVEFAVERRLVLHARSDPNAIRQLFGLNSSLYIIWAHAGMFTQPETIRELLDEYPTLWVEISHRGDVAPEGSLNGEWRALMLRHPNRFLLGSGTYNSQYWYQFRYAMSGYRDWLLELPPEIAERIAFRNGVELFGLPINGK